MSKVFAADLPPDVNRPKGDNFRQQKLTAWNPIITPLKLVVLLVAIGVAFIPTGTYLMSASDKIYEARIEYDGPHESVDCSIDVQNQGKTCSLVFDFDRDVPGPLYVYYELEQFYQNHRRYVSSRSASQLSGSRVGRADLEIDCVSLVSNGSLLLNPCGLIANSYFTDVFSLASSSPAGLALDEGSIAWGADRDLFKQPEGFQYVEVDSTSTTCASVDLPDDCSYYNDTSTSSQYLFYYPHAADSQYLYQTYPGLISPIKGVTDQHFKVWMRPAAMPTFRKLYAKIHHHFKSGDQLTFDLTANYEVGSFEGSKSLLLSTLGEFGGKNGSLGIAYVVVGSVCLFLALVMVLKQLLMPRERAAQLLPDKWYKRREKGRGGVEGVDGGVVGEEGGVVEGGGEVGVGLTPTKQAWA